MSYYYTNKATKVRTNVTSLHSTDQYSHQTANCATVNTANSESFIGCHLSTHVITQWISQLSSEQSPKFSTHTAALNIAHKTACCCAFKATTECPDYPTYSATCTATNRYSNSPALATSHTSTQRPAISLAILPTPLHA